MRRTLAAIGAWMGATALAAAVAWAAVSIVDDQVSTDVDLPLSAAEVERLAAARPAAAPTATTVPAMAPTTTTGATTPATTAGAEQTRAISVEGGTIVVRWSEAGVRLTSATPDAGWYVEVEASGPPQVEVTFEADEDRETEVRVSVVGGELRIEVRDE